MDGADQSLGQQGDALRPVPVLDSRRLRLLRGLAADRSGTQAAHCVHAYLAEVVAEPASAARARGETLEPRANRVLRLHADDAVDLAAAGDHEQGRNTADVEAAGRRRVFVDVEFRDAH